MRPEQIKSELETRKTTLTAVARQIGVSQQTVTNVVRGRTKSARIERAIAEALDKPIYRVFPDRYEAPPDAKEMEMVSIPRDELEAIQAKFQQAIALIERFAA